MTKASLSVSADSRYSVGLDIGTTSISASVLNLSQKTQVAYRTVKNSFSVKSDAPDLAMQDADLIFKALSDLLSELLSEYSSVKVIGITGQMHGIVYTDKNGMACSPLFTWQDRRAERRLPSGEAYCEAFERLTGDRIAAGYGMATHFYNIRNGLVPQNAHSFRTIMDYVASRLTENPEIPMHASNAASIGLFDPLTCKFRTDLFARFDTAHVLPTVTNEPIVVGQYRSIPVSIAIGDNQASFLGSVKNPHDSILLNIGTGSQISAMSPFVRSDGDIECRPLFKDSYLLCGSALSGGASYAMAERFFSEYAETCGISAASQYAVMNNLAEAAYRSGRSPLTVDTRFRGTRSDPARRGAITEIGTDNFTPGQLLLGILYGMCRELYELFPASVRTEKHTVVASGNAVQRIPILKEILETMFALPVFLSETKEEAATGAALFASCSASFLSGMGDFSDFIRICSTSPLLKGR